MPQTFCGAVSHMSRTALLLICATKPGLSRSNPDIGGQAFVIADPGPPPMYGNMYTIMETLTDVTVSPTFMMILAHLLEWYYRTQQSLVRKGYKFAFLMPTLKGDISYN
jgi:hypothetical protein